MKLFNKKFFIKNTLIRFRLSVYRSNKNIYAQIIDDSNSKTLISCSTLDKNITNILNKKNNCEVAWLIGRILAERCLQKNINNIIFDKGLYIYHGRIRALAEGARVGNLKF